MVIGAEWCTRTSSEAVHRGKSPAHGPGMTTSLTLALPAAGGHQQTAVLSRLTDLAGSWDQLAIGSGMPTHHYSWASACVDVIARASDLHLVSVAHPRRPGADQPLVR